MTPEQKARVSIDALQQEGWQGYGVAVRELPLNSRLGFTACLTIPGANV
ncbi:hypothetical protein LP415_20675 [Polaromonas sp. P1(28)-8]|nr:hypothetical protein LP415_20675 [Polaromonas sp. P1(28)-8]